MSGKLFLVPTPLGNLQDITLRALETLKTVDAILCEDTRQTIKLLQHFGIEKRLIAHHQHNEHKAVAKIIEHLLAGETLALVSDAGTPGVSDPGFLITREAVSNGIEVICLPGATALIPAIVCSGLPTDKFIFEGFLPHKKGRQTRILSYLNEERTVIFYESPHRVIKTLEQFLEFYGPDRKVSVSREISKIYEETIRGTVIEVLSHFKLTAPRGEFVIVLGGIEK